MFEMEFVSQKRETCCGPASLKMLLGYYGVDVAFDALIEECGVSVDGCTAGDLLRVGRAHGLEGLSAYQTDAEDVLKQDRPAILHWRGAHFLVYGGLNEKDEPVLYNPGRGVYAIDRGTFAVLFSGIMLSNGTPEDVHLVAGGNYATGEVFAADRQTYRALRPIARGEKLTEGANCVAVNLIDLINEQKTEGE